MTDSESRKNFESEYQEIDFLEIFKVLWMQKWQILLVTTVFGIGSIVYVLGLSDEYKSSVILAPSSSSGGSTLSKFAGQFGGLASLAGVNLGGGNGENKTGIAIEIIKTWGFLEKFIADNNIQVELYASKGWNKLTNKVVIDSEIYDEKSGQWLREHDPSLGQKPEPSSWELYKELDKRVSVRLDESSGLVYLSVEHYSPHVAKEWADELVSAINTYLQVRDRNEALKSIEYLKNKISETNVAGMQTVFYQLIEEQTKTLMLAEVGEEYVFKTISEARVSEEKFKPRRAIIVILLTFVGGVVAVVIVLVRSFISSRKPNCE